MTTIALKTKLLKPVKVCLTKSESYFVSWNSWQLLLCTHSWVAVQLQSGSQQEGCIIWKYADCENTPHELFLTIYCKLYCHYIHVLCIVLIVMVHYDYKSHSTGWFLVTAFNKRRANRWTADYCMNYQQHYHLRCVHPLFKSLRKEMTTVFINIFHVHISSFVSYFYTVTHALVSPWNKARILYRNKWRMSLYYLKSGLMEKKKSARILVITDGWKLL